jgi:hypothetical protein
LSLGWQTGQPREQLHRRAAENACPLAVGEFGTGLDLLAAGDSNVAAQVEVRTVALFGVFSAV